MNMWFVKNYWTFTSSAKGYKNADVHFLILKKTGKIWSVMKDVGRGMGVKNISDLVLKIFTLEIMSWQLLLNIVEVKRKEA